MLYADSSAHRYTHYKETRTKFSILRKQNGEGILRVYLLPLTFLFYCVYSESLFSQTCLLQWVSNRTNFLNVLIFFSSLTLRDGDYDYNLTVAFLFILFIFLFSNIAITNYRGKYKIYKKF